jgi:uncharacterized membrane protein YbhN (UPF0104 family)
VRPFLPAAISVVSLVACVWWATRQETPTLPRDAGHLGLAAAAIGVYVGVTALCSWRWDAILRRCGIGHRHADAYGLTVVGYMGNTVLPARGGDVLRVILLRQRSSAGARGALGSIVPERLLDAAALALFLAVVTVAGVGDRPTGAAPAIVAVALVAVGAAALVLYLRLRIRGRFARLADRIRPFTRATRLLLRPIGAVLLLASLVVWTLEFVVFSLVASSLGLPVSVPDAALVVTLVGVSSMVPAGPGFVGTFDAAVLFGLHAFDIGGGAAVACVLLYRFVIFVPITLAGLALMGTRYGGLAMLRSRKPVLVESA